MDEPRKHQVSLRGASAKEITRDGLLEKVNHERELRHFNRRAAAATLFIQRVWRRYYATKKAALLLRENWELSLTNGSDPMTKIWISLCIVRPFLFFTEHLSIKQRKIQLRDISCINSCFIRLLQSINSVDSNQNFCSLATGTNEERRIWVYQSRKLITLCSFMLKLYDSSSVGKDMVAVTSLALRFVITLTDLKGWKCISDQNSQFSVKAVKDLIFFIGSHESGVYRAVGKYFSTLSPPSGRQSLTDDKFLITASVVTLALRPFQVANMDLEDSVSSAMQSTAELYCSLIIPIPWLTHRIPRLLLPALRHATVLVPCFRTLLMLNKKILMEYMEMDQSGASSIDNAMPRVGWALSNIVCLVTDSESNSSKFIDGVDCATYVHVINALAQNFLDDIEHRGCQQIGTEILQQDTGGSAELFSFLHTDDITFGSLRYMDLLRPVSMQWHLLRLMSTVKMGNLKNLADTMPMNSDKKKLVGLELLDVAQFYSHMIRIYSMINTAVGSLPLLNMLSFTPGFLVNIWQGLEASVFLAKSQGFQERRSLKLRDQNDGVSDNKQKRHGKDGSIKWVIMLQRITGKPQADSSHVDFVNKQVPCMDSEDDIDVWDVETMRSASRSISWDTLFILHLFCATYTHLLLVLDDIEFYEKQVPFSLEQQRSIAAMLNTFVYNGLLHGYNRQTRFLMDAAIKCLQMLYERDCRHRFCPSSLWLAPARYSRPPIAAAARTHEVLSLRSDDSLTTANVGSFITTTPHVYPFEERVQMFREFIEMDKVSRKMAGELAGPNERSIEIVVRRSHIVEDGFQQLNSQGSKLKSSIHVSFVSDCGLPEAGLDYGGLSKEFLTDIAKAAFSPEYGLLSQTSTSERLLIPNADARFQDNGIQMIEFLGRIVGKALYEGILLDYSFSHVFVQKLLGRYSFLDELSTLDPELYKNLMYLKHYDGDVKELSLDFTVTEEAFGKVHVIELKPGGRDISVTNENKLHYIHAIADYKLNRQILPLSNAFHRGLVDLISPSWLRLFNVSEFNQLLSGGNHDIDVDDLRNNTRYTGGYTEGSRTVKLLWEVISGFQPKERCMLLKFVTSCSRAPLLGFKHLQPIFTIHKVECDAPLWAAFGGQDVDRLPSASTCYNTLKLPTYKRASTLREKLLYAINSNAGFELS